MSVEFDDYDNPEWTEEDFARARPASELPSGMLAAFPRTVERLKREAAANTEKTVRSAVIGQHDGARGTLLAA